MAIVPIDLVAKIQFFEDHNAPWSSNAVAVGTTSTAVTALATKTAAARAAYDAQQAAKLAAKDATLALKIAVLAMTGAGGDIIKQIKAKASIDGDGVYVLASIPAPAAPSPKPPPGTPTDFKVALAQGGALTLTWKCPNPPGASGTVYTVARRFAPAEAWAVVGAAGERKFVDDTIPAGTPAVTYRITAIRSNAQGPEALFTVNFGVSEAGGQLTASVQQGAPKLAA